MCEDVSHVKKRLYLITVRLREPEELPKNARRHAPDLFEPGVETLSFRPLCPLGDESL